MTSSDIERIEALGKDVRGKIDVGPELVTSYIEPYLLLSPNSDFLSSRTNWWWLEGPVRIRSQRAALDLTY